MVERVKSEIVDRFNGVCTLIEKTPDQLNEGGEQWHLELEPEDKELLKGSKTGKFHVWLRITKNSADDKIADGSKLDKYVGEIEAVMPEAKKLDSVKKVLDLIKGKKIQYVRKVLGKSFKGYEAKPDFVPQQLLK